MTTGTEGARQEKGLLFIVSAPSGAGKTTLCREVVKELPGLRHSVSYTTRKPRPGEVDGRDYFFLDEGGFRKKVERGEFLEWAEVHGHLYATPARFVDEGVAAGRVVVLDVDVQGGASVRRARPDAVSVFVYPPSVDALRQRLLKRNTESSELVERRLREAPWELAQYPGYDFLVMNDDLESAVRHLVAIVDTERSRVRRLRPRF
jgi:guanylate kinase